MKLILLKLFVWTINAVLFSALGLVACLLIWLIVVLAPESLVAIAALIVGVLAFVALLLAYFKAQDIINRDK